jgi:hypothetical protein
MIIEHDCRCSIFERNSGLVVRAENRNIFMMRDDKPGFGEGNGPFYGDAA